MIYLDNSATTKQYPEVTRLMIDYMDESFGNPSSLYQLGVDSEKAIKTARRQVEKAMGIGAEGGSCISHPEALKLIIWLFSALSEQ